MEIQTIQCFISVARNRNFTRAAEECHITQAAMSKKISSLESELGIILFYRDNRQVELTPAGFEFLSRANTLLEVYESTIRHTRNIANGFTSSLKIGIGSYEHLLLSDPLQSFCSKKLEMDVVLSQFQYKPLAEHLTDHLVDVILSTDQYLYSIPGVKYHIIHDMPWCFVCNARNSLCQKEHLTLKELSSQAFITMNDGSHEQIRRCFLPYGFDPRRFYRVNTYATKILALQANLGITTLPAFTESYMPPDICFLNTTPEYTPRKFVIAYLEENQNPTLHAFVNAVLSDIQSSASVVH